MIAGFLNHTQYDSIIFFSMKYQVGSFFSTSENIRCIYIYMYICCILSPWYESRLVCLCVLQIPRLPKSSSHPGWIWRCEGNPSNTESYRKRTWMFPKIWGKLPKWMEILIKMDNLGCKTPLFLVQHPHVWAIQFTKVLNRYDCKKKDPNTSR